MTVKRLFSALGLLVVIVLCTFIATINANRLRAAAIPIDTANISASDAAITVSNAVTPTTTITYGFGRPATSAEIEALDIDVRPDGVGLPPGSGTVEEGATLYTTRCASCHGLTGTEGPYNVLVGPYDNSDWPQTPLTIGNYWPYASTIYGYINRAMPHEAPGSLTPDEVYALTAWLLYQNGIVAGEAVLDAEALPEIEMPAHGHWIPHDLRDSYPFR